MSSYVIPGFSSMRGFGMTGVPSGFCGGIAILGANYHRPSVTNAGYSLSPNGAANLYRYFRTHTYKDPGQGSRLMCDANGAMNIYGIFAGLSAIASGTHVLNDSGYTGTFDLAGYHEAIKAILTRHTAVITEWANGQALGGDEPNLHYHFTSLGGIDSARPDVDNEYTGGYATCDDDWSGNAYPARANLPVWHAWPTLELAQPIAYVVCAA